jgi:uncharacterized membrane protein YqjE
MSETRYIGANNGRTLGEVLAGVKDELKDFMQTRLQMFVNEMREKIQNFKRAAVSGAAGLLLLITAYLFLNLALVGLVAVAFWGSPYAWFLAFLIVGGFWLIMGGMLALMAVKQFQGLTPSKTIEVLKADKVWLQQEVRNQE